MKNVVQFLSNHSKLLLALLGGLVFVGVAFLPSLFGASEKPVVDREGKIKVEKVKEGANGGGHQDKEKGIEIKSLLVDGTGAVYVGGKYSLHVLRGDKLEAVADFPGEDVKGMAGGGKVPLLTASKAGLHRLENGKWTKLHEAEGQAVSVDAAGVIYYAPKKMGLLKSEDGGKSWSPVSLPGMEMGMKGGDHGQAKKKE